MHKTVRNKQRVSLLQSSQLLQSKQSLVLSQSDPLLLQLSELIDVSLDNSIGSCLVEVRQVERKEGGSLDEFDGA